MPHRRSTKPAPEPCADRLELEPDVRAKLCSVAGEHISLEALVAQWKNIRERFSEIEAAKLEAAIRRRWERA